MKMLTALFLGILLSASNIQTVDHSEFIEGPFASPKEVTETCLMCHEGVDHDIMKTKHWTWEGKKKTINNFCIAVPSNWPRCTSCHIGYGWKDNSFNFNNSNNIDCLICHDQTGTYKKVPTGAGKPDESVDLLKVAQSVGKTTINNCSICHFNGGGGTGVKHGDMDSSLIDPSPEIDVHMGGLGFTCSDCHAGSNHQILGASHGSMASGTNHISCEDCHGEDAHERNLLNQHTKSIACETCHIPAFAREEPTKTWWDWSAAGQDRKVENDENGMPLYAKKKGDFAWAKDVVPEYRWYNGQADYYAIGDRMNPDQILSLNQLNGDISDDQAKITPFKLMRGKQIYDSENNYLIVPNLFGEKGYWKTFDWDQSAKLGMQTIGLDYSGRFGFIETEMYWPINHMVAPAEQALKCKSCHFDRGDKRLNWEALGYSGDPIRYGGRFSAKPAPH